MMSKDIEFAIMEATIIRKPVAILPDLYILGSTLTHQ